jgi:hypothetical protein
LKALNFKELLGGGKMDPTEESVSIQVRLNELENEIAEAFECHDCARLKLLLEQNQQLCWALWRVDVTLAQKAVTGDFQH